VDSSNAIVYTFVVEMFVLIQNELCRKSTYKSSLIILSESWPFVRFGKRKTGFWEIQLNF
jgi:hypothetical protein